MSLRVGELFARLSLDDSRFTASIRRSGRELTLFDRTIGRTSSRVMNFGKVLTGVAVLGMGALAAATTKAGDEMLGFERRWSVLANSLNELPGITTSAAKEMNWLRETALNTGSSFEELSKAFARLVPNAAANKIAIDDVRDALVGTIGAGVIMGATHEEMKRAFIALGQVVGKNALQMEELRQQLGEAMPNAMLIAASGLTKLKRATGEIGPEATISIGQLVKMINQSKIDGATFIKMWKLGTAEFKKFAQAAKFTIGGQLQNLGTVLTTRIGNLMISSGLQNTLISIFDIMNREIDQWLDRNAHKFDGLGDWLIGLIHDVEVVFKVITGRAADFNESVGNGIVMAGKGLLVFIETVVQGIKDIMNIPVVGPAIAEVGIIGFLFLGIKGKAIIATASAAFAGLKRVYDEVVLAIDNMDNKFSNLSIIDGKSANFDFGAGGVTNVQSKGAIDDQTMDAVLNNVFAAVGGDKATFKKFLESGLDERMRMIADIQNKITPELQRTQKAVDAVTKAGKRDPRDPNRKSLAKQIEASIGTDMERKKLQPAAKELKARRDDLKKQSDAAQKIMQDLARRPHETAMKILATNKKAQVELNKAEDPFTAALKNWEGTRAEQIKKNKEQIDEFQKDMLKQRTFIQQSNVNALEKLTERQQQRLISKYSAITQGYEDVPTPASIISAKMNKDMMELRIDEEFLPLLGHDPREVENAILRKHAGAASDIKSGETVREVNRDYETRLMLLNEIEQRMIGIAGIRESLGFVDDGGRTKHFEELRARLEQRTERMREQARKRETDTKVKIFDRNINMVAAIAEAENNAIDTIIVKQLRKEEAAMREKKERFEIANGLRDEKAALFSLNENELRRKAVAAQLKSIQEQMVRLREEERALSDDQVQKAMRKLQLEQLAKELGDQGKELDKLRDPRIREGMIKLDISRLQLDIEASKQRRALLANDEARRLTIASEIEKLRLEQANLRMQAEVQANAEFKKELLQLEYDKLLLEEKVLQNQLLVAENDQISQKKTELDIMREQVRLMDLMRKYSVDFATYLKLNAVTAAQQLTGVLSSSIEGLIMGTMTLKEAFTNLFQSIIGGIIKAVAEYQAQAIVAWIIQKTGMVRQTAAVREQSVQMAEAWKPAAYAAAVATNGEALKHGDAALSKIDGLKGGGAAAGEGAGAGASIFSIVFSKIQEVLGDLFGWMKNIFNDLFGSLGDLASDFFDTLADAGSSLFKSITSAFSSSSGSSGGGILKTIFGAVAGGISGGIGGGFGGFGGGMASPITGFGAGGGIIALHSGGIFSNGLSNDEGLAVLQNGEMVIPRKSVAATINAMRMLNVPMPKGVYHDGGIFGQPRFATDNVDQDSINMGGGQTIINVFSKEELGRMLKRHPGAVVNTMIADHRNNGASRSVFAR